MGLSFDIVPLPAAEVGRAPVEQAVRQENVAIVLNLAEGEADAMDVVLSPQAFRPFGRFAARVLALRTDELLFAASELDFGLEPVFLDGPLFFDCQRTACECGLA